MGGGGGCRIVEHGSGLILVINLTSILTINARILIFPCYVLEGSSNEYLEGIGSSRTTMNAA